MFKSLLVGVLAPVSSVLLVLGMGNHLEGDASESFLWGALATSLVMSLAVNWPKGIEPEFHPIWLVAWIFVIGWRTWGKTLVTMGIQALTALVLLVSYFRIDIHEVLPYCTAIAVPTAFLLAALIFAPKEKKIEQRQPARETASA